MPTQSKYDVIVVGTGPGGATVARELTRGGKRVLLLERAPGGPVRGTLRQCLSELLMPSKSWLVTPDHVNVLRGITVGGSSTFFYGTALSPSLEMLRRHGLDVARDVEEARAELHVAPLDDAMISPMASRIASAARQIGLPWAKLDKCIDPSRWKPGSRFGYYGDPTGVRWSARSFVDDAVAKGATLVTNARVELVLVERDQATGVEYAHGGARRRASADAVVVAAGGIGSPIILRASGIAEAGTDFFFDPLVTAAGTISDVTLRDDEIPMSAGALFEREGFMLADMALPRPLHAFFSVQAGRPEKTLSFRHTARIMVKARDALSGSISARGGVDKRLLPSDREKLDRGYDIARRVLEAAGAKDIHRSACWATHPGGTAKIGDVVDSTLQTRFKNLYVCDASVIPEAWGLPPSLTIVALAKRLARQLAEVGVERARRMDYDGAGAARVEQTFQR